MARRKILVPLAIFKDSPSPCGLYARRKWFGEEDRRHWQNDYRLTVADLRRGQGANGLWQDSPFVTVHRLFGLHLTVREPDAPIDRAIEALVARASTSPGECGDGPLASESLDGLPFAPSRWTDFFLPATLFLASIFGRAEDARVRTLYATLLSPLTAGPLDARPPATIHNTLRAVAVHPEYARHPATGALVAWYARRQTPQGDWGAEIPFYQALNALAHLENTTADDQCRKAFDSLAARRNADGSWGKRQPQWDTFLTIHALHNSGRLSPSWA